MPNGRTKVAQAFYLAQLQACKGKCQCNVCKLLRQASDDQVTELLNPTTANPGLPQDALEILKSAGYDLGRLPPEESQL
ncbi:hypothetical protein ES703_103105 [subsurface metagenome]